MCQTIHPNHQLQQASSLNLLLTTFFGILRKSVMRQTRSRHATTDMGGLRRSGRILIAAILLPFAASGLAEPGVCETTHKAETRKVTQTAIDLSRIAKEFTTTFARRTTITLWFCLERAALSCAARSENRWPPYRLPKTRASCGKAKQQDVQPTALQSPGGRDSRGESFRRDSPAIPPHTAPQNSLPRPRAPAAPYLEIARDSKRLRGA